MGNSTSSPFKHFINTNQETNPLDPLDTPIKPITQSKPPKTMLLKLYVCDDSDLKSKYTEQIATHNINVMKPHFDSGFDLFNPSSYTFDGEEEQTLKYDLCVRAAAFDSVSGNPMPFYVYPRSSIYKTPLRLANSVGIIDAGYRGNLCALLDKKPEPPTYTINPGARLLQICAPDLRRINVCIVDNPDDLGNTERGDGGFGSTGN